ncbi:MAG: DUF418 domain-containing protein [Acidobacteriota bacterium]
MPDVVVAAPVRGRERIMSLDVIRGVALFGILLMNITMFGLPMSYSDPTVWGGATGPNLWAWITATVLFEGTQRGIFSILFGAGLILLTSRLDSSGRADAADIFYRRSLWLLVFGIIHSYLLLWSGEILYYYGLTALFLHALRKLQPRALLTIAGAGLVIGAVWNVADSYHATETWNKAAAAQAVLATGGTLTSEQQADLDAWKAFEGETKPDERTLTRDIEAHRGSYLDVLTFQAPLNAHYQSWFAYRYFFDIFSMMLVGMALFKMGALTLERPPSLYWKMALAGYPIGLAINLYELQIVLDGQFSVLSLFRASWTYDLGRLAMTVGHLGALLLFCRSGWLRWLQQSLAAVGRMALSNYVAHSIICAFVFYGFGFGLYGRLERHQLYYVVVAIWVFQLVTSPIWLRHYRFGPFEWLWRWLTYLQRPPMRRAVGGGTPAPQPQEL